jgi:hypothetical protein
MRWKKKGKSENRNIFKHDHLIELCFSGFVFNSLKKKETTISGNANVVKNDFR